MFQCCIQPPKLTLPKVFLASASRRRYLGITPERGCQTRSPPQNSGKELAIICCFLPSTTLALRRQSGASQIVKHLSSYTSLIGLTEIHHPSLRSPQNEPFTVKKVLFAAYWALKVRVFVYIMAYLGTPNVISP